MNLPNELSSIGSVADGDNIADSINHYIEKHGYRLLHVGTESARDYEGKLWHHTVAVLGHDNPPALMPPVKIEVMGIPEDMQKPRAGTEPKSTK